MTNDRQTLERAMQDAGRRLSAATIAFHRKVAAKLGLNDTDHKCLDLLLREGPMTSGTLARKGGYTTGAVTGIINRLAAKGFVTRRSDQGDARKVVLEADAKLTHERLWPHLRPMTQRMSALHSEFDDAQLRLVQRYLENCIQILVETAPETDP